MAPQDSPATRLTCLGSGLGLGLRLLTLPLTLTPNPNPSPNPNPASVVTGTRAATLCGADGKTPLDWKDAMDDTCESFGMRDLFEGNVRRKHA